MKKNRFPEGWDEKRVRRVLEHYEGQRPRRLSPKIKPPTRTPPRP